MPRRSAVSLARTTILAVLLACLVLGVSSSRIAGGGLATQEAASVADPFVITKVLRRSLQWWNVNDNEDEDDKRKNDDDDDDRVKDDDDDDDDDDDKCAERDDRSQECGASDSFPRECCGSLVCDGTRCRREDDEDDEDDEDEEDEEEVKEESQVKTCADPGERSQVCGGNGGTPESCCGDNICNMETKRCEEQECSLLGRRSQQCGGGGALPVTCCGNLVCNEDNRCGDPANSAGNDDGEKDAGVPDTPDTSLSPASTPSTFEPTLDPTMEPTKEAGGFVATSGATSRAAVAAWVSICASALYALF